MNQHQLKSAYALAAHFGHSLANLPFCEVVRLASNPEGLREAVEKTQEGDIHIYGENQMPKIDHTTCTGNTRVRILESGDYMVERYMDGRRVAVATEGKRVMGTVSAAKKAAEDHMHGMMARRAQLVG